MKPLIIAFSCLSLVSCASLSSKYTTETSPPKPSVEVNSASAMDNLPQSGLGPQTLQPGECGLFLWSQTDTSKFIFFTRAVSGTALVSQSAGPVDLAQTTAGGEIFGQFNTETSYAASDGALVQLKIVAGEELEGGQRISSGLITTTDPEGWVTKLPVLGVRACQPE